MKYKTAPKKLPNKTTNSQTILLFPVNSFFRISISAITVGKIPINRKMVIKIICQGPIIKK